MEEGKHHPERVKINVGGTVFETLVSTFTKFDNSVFCDLVADRNEEELFIDRDPVHFSKILSYLRDAEHFKPPLKNYDREILRQEAEFYKLPGLVKLCSPEVLHVGDTVLWSESAKESFWLFLSNKDMLVLDACDYCGHSIVVRKHPFAMEDAFVETYIRTAHVKSHMSSMRGTIVSQRGNCWHVRWRTAPETTILRDISKSAHLLTKAK
ncbi:unnamed protein product [Cylicocyclus nassatus]|uniref:BTB domain-containing protein n=1 Tax=Cylicocyclus nassatus TaxID=53992 RepID=A0AA36GVK9_CYLNA|nr:unnamed protein product [Cylicocyclus nassatus]